MRITYQLDYGEGFLAPSAELPCEESGRIHVSIPLSDCPKRVRIRVCGVCGFFYLSRTQLGACMNIRATTNAKTISDGMYVCPEGDFFVQLHPDVATFDPEGENTLALTMYVFAIEEKDEDIFDLLQLLEKHRLQELVKETAHTRLEMNYARLLEKSEALPTANTMQTLKERESTGGFFRGFWRKKHQHAE